MLHQAKGARTEASAAEELSIASSPSAAGSVVSFSSPSASVANLLAARPLDGAAWV
jgi:hypothetical protein